MPSLKQLFDQAPKRFAELSAGLAARAVRAEWSTFDRHSLEPHYFERNRYGRGRLLKDPVVDPKGLTLSFFDADDRLILTRDYNELAPRKEPGTAKTKQRTSVDPASAPGFIHRPCKQEFYEYFADHADSILFADSPAGSVINVGRYKFDGERLVELTRRFRNSKQSHERFEWEGPLLLRVHVAHGAASHVDEFAYDVAGQLTSIDWVYPTGQRAQTYQRVTQPLKPLLRQIEELLTAAIEERLAALRLKSPAAAVALWLNLEGYEHVLPPGLAVLPEAERAEFVEEHADRAGVFVWNPVEWELFEDDELELEAPRLHDLCKEANQLLWQNSSYADARKMVDKVCKTLNKRVAKLLASTNDCVVFPIDICSGDGAEGVARVTSAKQRKLLETAGLL